MKLILEVGKTYIARDGSIAKVIERVSSFAYPFRVKYADGHTEALTEHGSFSMHVGQHPLDLIAENTEHGRLYRFFASSHPGVLSDKWREYED